MKSFKPLFLSLLFIGLFTGCYDDMDDVIRPATPLEIKNFIWRGMNLIYLYKEEVPELADDAFATQGELNDYLQTFSSPEDLFYNGLVAQEEDEFSFLVEDYIALEKSLDGIRVSNGMEYGLRRYSEGSSLVYGYVRYVLPNTSAEEKGVTRGMIFNMVDGQQLTTDNFSRLLEPNSYTISLADKNGTEFTPTGESISLVKEEYTTNPVYLAKVIPSAQGKVGYLFYTGFTGSFDAVLNETFAMFKAEGITHLIVDLRYNPGGSVETAVDLGSMITGQFSGQVFFTEQWNEQFQTALEQTNPESLVHNFNNTISNGNSINSLGLTEVYVITTLRTASASELLINGLDPYINVIQVGENTTGKFQASRTLYDSPDFGRRGATLTHRYAIQPLIYKTLNKVGFTDYQDGLTPEIRISENTENLGIIGENNEPLLQAALNDILGKPQSFPQSDSSFEDLVGESGMNDEMYQRMYTTRDIPEVFLKPVE
jgi:carboxyl-terminal processing protease